MSTLLPWAFWIGFQCDGVSLQWRWRHSCPRRHHGFGGWAMWDHIPGATDVPAVCPGHGCARSPLRTISPVSPPCGSPKADDGVSASTHWCSPAQSPVVRIGSCGTDWDPEEPDRAWSCSPDDVQEGQEWEQLMTSWPLSRGLTPQSAAEQKPFLGWLSPDVIFLGLWFIPSQDPSHQCIV